MSNPSRLTFLVGVLTAVFTFTTAHAQTKAKNPNQILFTNVNIFDGKSDKLAMGMSVLVEGKPGKTSRIPKN